MGGGKGVSSRDVDWIQRSLKLLYQLCIKIKTFVMTISSIGL